MKTGSVFCMECDDIIADETFEDLFHSTTLHIEEKETKFISMGYLLMQVFSYS